MTQTRSIEINNIMQKNPVFPLPNPLNKLMGRASKYSYRQRFFLFALLGILIIGAGLGYVWWKKYGIPYSSPLRPENIPNLVALPPIEISRDVDVTLYVNPANNNASDDNEGTSLSAPLKTIQKAGQIAESNQANNISTSIVISPGHYREMITITGTENDSVIIIGAATPGTVTISGSDVWDGWQAQSDTIYTHNWPYDWGPYDNPWEKDREMDFRARMRELIFVNGERMLEVYDLADLVPASFYVNINQDIISLYPPDGVDMSTAEVEVGLREGVIELNNAYNVLVHDLTLEHAISGPGGGALWARDCKNIIVEDSVFLNNNWAGVDIRRCENVKMQNLVANHNGHRGLGALQILNLLVDDVENAYNNWRGIQGGWYEWDAGQKFLLIHNGIFRNYRAFDNEAAGLWLDFDNVNILVEDAYICNNYWAGIFIEASQGPITVKDSVICDTRAVDNYFGNGGIFSTNSSNVILENNEIYGNYEYQIRLEEVIRYRPVDDWETGAQYDLAFDNWVIKGNQISNTDSEQRLISLPNRNDYHLEFGNNTWYTPKSSNNFFLRVQSITNSYWQSYYDSSPILDNK